MMIYILSTVLKIERARVLDNIKGGVILGALVSSTLAIINTFLVYLEFSPLYRLLLIILSGAITLFIYSYYLKNFIITKDLTYLLRIISNNSSDKISQLIEKHFLESR